MRGTLEGIPHSLPRIGIIPAYAGNTFRRRRVRVQGGDHPRVCGEHRLFSIRFLSYRGSSPRMRGTLYEVAADFLGSGIIPAYAGNTNRRGESDADARDHPRVCGEHDTPGARGRARTGSSPRMRGTHDGSAVFVPRHGIIPAYAGNTCAIKGGTSYDWDHPRVCGEHKRLPRTHTTRPGSSPRMRGTHGVPAQICVVFGIIPAYAGNTLPTFQSASYTGDHPRVCGEHWLRGYLKKYEGGSSPRMRGTPSRSPLGAVNAGIIPAYAGNTK